MKKILWVQSPKSENQIVKGSEWEYFYVGNRYLAHNAISGLLTITSGASTDEFHAPVYSGVHDSVKISMGGEYHKAAFIIKKEYNIYELLYVDKGVLRVCDVNDVDITTLDDYLDVPEPEQTVRVKEAYNDVRFKVRDFDDPTVLYVEDYIRYVNLADIPKNITDRLIIYR